MGDTISTPVLSVYLEIYIWYYHYSQVYMEIFETMLVLPSIPRDIWYSLFSSFLNYTQRYIILPVFLFSQVYPEIYDTPCSPVLSSIPRDIWYPFYPVLLVYMEIMDSSRSLVLSSIPGDISHFLFSCSLQYTRRCLSNSVRTHPDFSSWTEQKFSQNNRAKIILEISKILMNY